MRSSRHRRLVRRPGTGRRSPLLTMCVATALTLAALVPSAASAALTATQQLADKYSPILRVRKLEDVCETSEEQYSPPTTVDIVLGNPAVRLLYRDRKGTKVITRAPTVADLVGRGPGYYLDLPGDPLMPGCKFAKDFRALRQAGKAPAVTYAHIARQPGVAGFALQYWFYWYFNQFNDLHESDWEGMQLWFTAATPEQALADSPSQIVLFQHAGGEHADWDAGKVEKEGTHPVVYPAAGSHATYYSSALYLGNGQGGSGVGCDDTTKPLVTVYPRAVLTPDVPVARGSFAWLTFTGRWGQLEAGFNNGPTGPNTKTQWRDPYTWMVGTRTASPTVPAGSLAGPSIGHAFCGAVATVTGVINLAARTLPGALALALGGLLIVLIPALVTSWRPVVVFPLNSRRKLGQVILAAARLCLARGPTVLLIAASCLFLIAAFDVLEYLMLLPFGVHTTGLSFDSSQATVGIFTSGGIGQPIVQPIAVGLSIALVRNLDHDDPASFRQDVRTLLDRFWRVVLVQVVVLVLVGLIALTIIGIPYAIYKVPQWQFAAQEVLFEDRSIRDAIHASTDVVRGHWWLAASRSFVFFVISEVPGPVLGFALLFAPIHPGVVNGIGAVIYSLLMPYATIGRTLVYLDLKQRPVKSAVRATRIAAEPGLA